MKLSALMVFPKVEIPSAADALRRMAAMEGREIYERKDALPTALLRYDVPQPARGQLGLIFSQSELASFLRHIGEEGFGAAQANSAIQDVILSTGLQAQVARPLVLDVFASLGFEQGRRASALTANASGAFQHRECALLPRSEAEIMCRRAHALSQQELEPGTPEYTEYHSLVARLCEAGEARGLFLRAEDYETGRFGTAQNSAKAADFYQAAFKCGDPLAAQRLGDLGYRRKAYTRAYDFLTAPGSVPLNSHTQAALVQMQKQKRLNAWNLLFAFLALGLFLGFARLFHAGIYSGATAVPAAIALGVLAALIFAGGVAFRLWKPFDDNRWAVPGIFLCWAVYAAVLIAR